MSESSPTLSSLVALGFERVPGQAAETVRYEFQNFELSASSVMWWRGMTVMLGGHGSTGRELLVMDPGGLSSAKMIPNDLDSVEAAAWVSFMLQTLRNDLGPLPDWFVEGERHWDLVPPARERLAYKERQRVYEERLRAYEASPKCLITREDARPIRRSLLEYLSLLDRETEMVVQFDGRVLTIDLYDRFYRVPAFGDNWPYSCRVIVTPESKLPPRFEHSWVEVSIFEGHLCWDRLPLGPCETVTGES